MESSSGAFHIPAVQGRRADGQSLRERQCDFMKAACVCVCLQVRNPRGVSEFETPHRGGGKIQGKSNQVKYTDRTPAYKAATKSFVGQNPSEVAGTSQNICIYFK